MLELFYGWKRKAGLVMLLIACAFAAWWVRSRSVLDMVFVRDRFIIVSGDWGVGIAQRVRLKWGDPQGVDPGFVDYNQSSMKEPIDIWSTTKYSWKNLEIESPAVPYISIVIPLTVISAWLLLSKRRQPTKTETSSESTA